MRAMFMTTERYPFALGTTTPMTVHWPERDDITDWTPSSIDTGNIRTLQGGNKLMAGAVVGSVNLIWSDTTCFLCQYVNLPFIYDIRAVGENAGLIGGGAYCIAEGTAFWMSKGRFLMSNGSTVLPVPKQDDIVDYVYNRADLRHADKFYANYYPDENEIMFGYVKSGDTEPMDYMLLSLTDWSWTPGTLARTGMAHLSTAQGGIVGFGQDGYVYDHETGTDADGAAMEAYVVSGISALEDGRRDMDITRYVHDVERQVGALSVIIRTKARENAQAYLEEVTLNIQPTDTENDENLIHGRWAEIEFNSNVIGGDFALGRPSLELQPAGGR
jgi:hypothetical protein